MVPQDVPDAPREYTDVSLAIDFDTDHGYKKPPAWHLWQLQRLGFKGHADVYMGVFWNNKRQRTGATYPYATVAFSGTPAAGDVVSLSIGGTTVSHAIGYGETLQSIASHVRAMVNGLFSGVWADDNFGSSTTVRIQSKAPSYTFTGLAVSAPNSVTLTLTDHLGVGGHGGRLGTARLRVAGHDGGRAEVDSRSRQPVRGGGHPGVVRVLDGGL